jgi:alpha-acetolactate decarboxylase
MLDATDVLKCEDAKFSKQNRSHPRLVEIARKQPTFEFNQAKGTVVGFRLPEFTKTMNVTGTSCTS